MVKPTLASDDRFLFQDKAARSGGTIQVARPNTIAPISMMRPDAGTTSSKIRPSTVASNAAPKIGLTTATLRDASWTRNFVAGCDKSVHRPMSGLAQAAFGAAVELANTRTRKLRFWTES